MEKDRMHLRRTSEEINTYAPEALRPSTDDSAAESHLRRLGNHRYGSMNGQRKGKRNTQRLRYTDDHGDSVERGTQCGQGALYALVYIPYVRWVESVRRRMRRSRT